MVYASGTDLVAFDKNGEQVMQINLADYYCSENGVYIHNNLTPEKLISDTGLASLLQSCEENQE